MSVETLGAPSGSTGERRSSRSAIVLLIANAIPIVGVLFFGWSLITILVLYWVENGIVGFWNIPKIALAQGSIIPTPPGHAARGGARGDPERRAGRVTPGGVAAGARELQAQGLTAAGSSPVLARLTLIPRAGLAIFFLVHYGIFWLVHGIFVFTLPMFSGIGSAFGGVAGCDGQIFPEPGEIPGAIGGVASCAASAFGEIAWGSVLIGAAALFLSHGASFLFNYIGQRRVPADVSAPAR